MNRVNTLVLSLLTVSGVTLSGPAISAQSSVESLGTRTVYASAAGAALNSNLMTGGGTDDTAVLQKVLNRAEHGMPIHLIIDGPALVSGLEVYGNTTVECIAGGGLYLKSGSNRAIIRNVHRSRDAIIDEHITVRGCFLHGNKPGQHGETVSYTANGVARQFTRNQEADGTYFAGLQFFGVNYLTIENVTIWNVRAFSSHIANANRVDLRNVIADNGIQPGDDWGNMDGFHFNGPIHYLTIEGMKLRTYDDGFTLGANDAGTDDMRAKNDMGPYVGQGPITDVAVSNVEFMDSLYGIRLMSSTERLDRVVISNVSGTVQGKLAVISHFTNPGLGNFGSISFSNVTVEGIPFLVPASRLYSFGEDDYTKFFVDPVMNLELGGTHGSLFVINGHIEALNLRNIMTRAVDGRPVIWSGHQTWVQMLDADLTDNAPSTPLKQEKGGRIEHLHLRHHSSSAL